MNAKHACGESEAIDFESIPEQDTTVFASNRVTVDSGLVGGDGARKIDNCIIQFQFPSDEKLLIDCTQSYLRFHLQIKKADGTKFTAPIRVAPVDGIGGSIIDKIELYNNGFLLKTWSGWSYIYYVINLLHRTKGYIDTIGKAALWYPDRGDDEPEMRWDMNQSIRDRRERTGVSAVFGTCGVLPLPPFTQMKWLSLANTNFMLKIYLKDSNWCLIKDTTLGDNYSMYIHKAELMITKLELKENVNQRITRISPKLYPYRDFKLQTFAMYQTLYQRTIPQTPLEATPIRMYIWMTSQKQLNGDDKTNPFRFKHYNLSDIKLTFKGKVFEYSNLNFSDEDKKDQFQYFDQAYRVLANPYLCFTPEEFIDHHYIVCFDLTDTMNSAECDYINADIRSPAEYQLEIKFKNPLPENVELFVLSEFEKLLSIDKDGNASII